MEAKSTPTVFITLKLDFIFFFLNYESKGVKDLYLICQFGYMYLLYLVGHWIEAVYRCKPKTDEL